MTTFHNVKIFFNIVKSVGTWGFNPFQFTAPHNFPLLISTCRRIKHGDRECTRNSNRIIMYYDNYAYTLKTPGSAWPGKRVHRGQTPFRVKTRKSVNLTRDVTQSWVILTPLFVNLTDFRVIVDPEWSLAPMDPFPGHGWPGCATRVF